MEKSERRKRRENNRIHSRMYQLLQKKFENAQIFNERLRASDLSPALSEAYDGYTSSLDKVILEEAKALVAASEN